MAVGVIQTDPAADPALAAATVPGARVFVLRAAGVSSEPVPGGEVLEGAPGDRAEAAAEVWARCGAARVVILHAGERLSPELAAELGRAGDAGAGPTVYRAPVRLRFLGRVLATAPAVIAWDGDPAAAGAMVECRGHLLAEAGPLHEVLAASNARATRAAARRRRVSAGDFLWRPGRRLVGRLYRRRRDGVPGLILSVMETYDEVLVAAKVWERTQADVALRPVPAGFRCQESPSGFVMIREDLGTQLERLLLAATPDDVDGVRLAGAGRGAAWTVRADGHPPAVLRWYRRGGVPRWFARDCFLVGGLARPVRELVVTEEARVRGIPVPEVLAVRVDGAGVGRYRGAIVTREFAGGVSLRTYLNAVSPSDAGDAVVTVATVVRQMHDRGLDHPDLNAGNILLRATPAGLDVCIIDLDRARIRASVSAWRRRLALRRLRRSLADVPAGARVQRAYWEAR